MGITANPPTQVAIPKKLFNDPELRAYFVYLQESAYRVWLRTGGGTDTLYDIVNNDLLNTTSVTELFSTVTPSTDFNAKVKTGSYTAVHKDFVEGRSNAIITLDPNAPINSQIMVANGDGSNITVSGSIKYKALEDSLILSQQGTSLHFHKFIDGTNDYWRVR